MNDSSNKPSENNGQQDCPERSSALRDAQIIETKADALPPELLDLVSELYWDERAFHPEKFDT